MTMCFSANIEILISLPCDTTMALSGKGKSMEKYTEHNLGENKVGV